MYLWTSAASLRCVGKAEENAGECGNLVQLRDTEKAYGWPGHPVAGECGAVGLIRKISLVTISVDKLGKTGYILARTG